MDELYTELLDQLRSAVRDEVEETIRQETRDAIIEYFTEDTGWDGDSSEYRTEAVAHIREAYEHYF